MGLWITYGTGAAPGVTWSTDLAGSTNSVQIVVKLTGSGGFVDVLATGQKFRYAAAVTAPGRFQLQATSGGGQTMEDRTQAAFATSGAAGGSYRWVAGKSDGAGAVPKWIAAYETVAGSTSTDFYELSTNANFDATLKAPSTNGCLVFNRTKFARRTVAGNITVDSGQQDLLMLVDTSAARTITLPNPALSDGRALFIKDIKGTAASFNITLARFGTEKIEGVAANRALAANWGSWILVCDGTDWFLFS